MKKEPIAIVGIGAIFPGSQDCAAYWNNTLEAKCFVREVPEDFWRKEDFYNRDPSTPDKTYSKNAGILDPIEFDAKVFGIPPKTMQSISVDQLFALVSARQALIDAGLYGKDAKPFDKSRTGVIISASLGKNVYELSARTNLVKLRRQMKDCNIPDEIIDQLIEYRKSSMIEWDEASNPGYLANVVSGRIANRFDFTGVTCSVDAACASGLAAVKFASQELWMGNSDVMLAGGIMLDLSSVSFVSFCKTPALSPSDCIRPFDERADGMILGDGVGIVVLKRLSTAEADGDRIYALIEGIGCSSDGREKSIFAPNKKGQISAITRALQDAEVDPKQVAMIETHGTGTSVGDTCEAVALSEVFNPNNEKNRSIVIGSSKGQIGHLRLAAGIASLIRTSLAIYHKQFVPSVGCEILNPAVVKSNMYLCKKAQPWISNNIRPIRYASVSAFGFGGTNYNMVLKEHKTDYDVPYRYTNISFGILIAEKDKESLVKELHKFQDAIQNDSNQLNAPEYTYRELDKSWSRIGFVAKNVSEALDKTTTALSILENDTSDFWMKKGILYRSASLDSSAKVTALYPGQGSQYIGMLSELSGAYPEMRKSFTIADNVMLENGDKPISEIVYAKAWLEDEINTAEKELVSTRYTQPALAAIEAGLYDTMKNRGFIADSLIGHSFGELVALYAAGVYDETDLMKVSIARGRYMSDISSSKGTGMLAIMADREYVKSLIGQFSDVYIANENSPKQIIISGSSAQLEMIETRAASDNIRSIKLKVSAAFHSPFMKEAQEPFKKVLKETKFNKPTCKVYSNYRAVAYDEKSVFDNLYNQITNPVLFQSSIEAAYKDGSRVFVEIGAGHILSSLVRDCLPEKDCIIITVNPDRDKDSLDQFETAMVHLAALGIPILPDPYYAKINSEIEIKKNKSTYTVPPTFFYLQETKERFKKAEIKAKASSRNFILDSAGEKNDRSKEQDEMNNYDAVCEIQRVSAEVFENYIKSQNEQLNQINSILKNSTVQTEANQKLLFDCVASFQDNSLKAFKTFFDGQSSLLGFQPIQAYSSEKEDHLLNATNINRSEPSNYSEPKDEVRQESITEIKQDTDVEKVDIEEFVIRSISEITGYPTDMIENDMELESDLGIDSIKRLELFSKINDYLGNVFEQKDMATLATIKTAQECIDVIVKYSALRDPLMADNMATDNVISLTSNIEMAGE